MMTSNKSKAFDMIVDQGGWVDVGNGGDAIFCEKDLSLNSLEGFYSLDYIATFDASLPENEPLQFSSWQKSLKNIQMILQPISQDMSNQLDEFITFAFNKTDLAASYLWQSQSFGMIDIKDENIELFQLPFNCLIEGEPKKVQAIIRQSPHLSGLPVWKTLYNFVPEVTSELGQKNPVQLSYLLLHEFLWSYTDNVSLIRRINRLLHSKKAQLLSADDLTIAMSELGFHFSNGSLLNASECNEKPIAISNLYKLQNQIQNGELSSNLSASLYTKRCTLERGCTSFYSDRTNSYIPNDKADLLNLISIVSDTTDQHKVLIAINPKKQLTTTLLQCDFVNKKQNLTNCQALNNPDDLWWNQNPQNDNIENFTLSGTLSETGLCLRGKHYQKSQNDWYQFLVNIHGSF